jgi:hypothetical protein
MGREFIESTKSVARASISEKLSRVHHFNDTTICKKYINRRIGYSYCTEKRVSVYE